MSMKFAFFCGLLNVVITSVCCQQEVLYANEGDTKRLICSITGEGQQTSWLGPPTYFIYSQNGGLNPKVNRMERLSLEPNNNYKVDDLQIKNLSKTIDGGLYSCILDLQQKKFELKFYIDVKNVSLDPGKTILTIKEGTQRNISCEVNDDADPAPNITWFIGPANLISTAVYTRKSFIIVTGKREDNTKTLQCKASNNYRPPETANTILNIEYPPTVNYLSQQDIIEGRTLLVTCDAMNGNPRFTTFSWTKLDNAGFEHNQATLQIPNIDRTTSAGIYKCTAENIYSDGGMGEDSQNMVVNVLYPPTVNSLSQQVIIEGRELLVTCNATPGNPNHTAFFWTKINNPGFRQNRTTLQISSINRTSSGNYRCTAENIYSNGEKGTDSQSMVVNVLYPPTVNTLSQQNIVEGRELSVTCRANDGNPSSTTFFWTKIDNPGFRQNRSTLQISSINRTSYGTYICTAQNIFNDRETGSNSQSMVVNVLYPPTVNTLSQQNIIEGRELSVTCRANDGNPSSTTFFWTKVDNPGFRQNQTTLQISSINRTSSGTYICTAQNIYNNRETGSNSQSMVVNVLYPPAVNTLSQQDIIEGRELSVICHATDGNPSSTTFFWTKVDKPEFRQNQNTLRISSINRTSSGTYKCTAQNIYNDRETGSNSQSMVVNVLYKPEIVKSNRGTKVNENEQVILYRQIISNPLSNVSWYNGSDLLKNQWLVKNATFNIEKATCTDTKNFTLLANNGVQENVTTLVELIVNCKPRSYKTNFTLGVTDTTGIDFSTFVIAYPKPLIKLEYENGTESDQMMKRINRNAVNNFTIHISQTVVNQSDFGVYHLKVWNSFGTLTVIVNVIAQRKPNVPVDIEIVCEETRAKVQWKSSFNGGDPQLFTVIASSGQQSNNISDRGENVIHSTFVQHLQPSTMYVFYVSAQNSHGFISSEKISCTTLAESSEKLPIIVGSAAAGGLTLLVVVVVIVFLFRRFTNTEKQAGKSQRFENDLVENESVDDDGLKDNILYVSADPRENEKHEAAVYAAVNKKDQMGDNNSNVYAEVEKNGKKDVKEGAIYSDVKPKKGFLKKDGKVKKEKRQKRKQEVADVYENSDDIAMTANPDNVYSNTNHNKVSAKEQRGYKNKDGLLYVEVQFDTKTEDKNPVIHGDDEKTDYATVEFPVPSSSHDRE